LRCRPSRGKPFRPQLDIDARTTVHRGIPSPRIKTIFRKQFPHHKLYGRQSCCSVFQTNPALHKRSEQSRKDSIVIEGASKITPSSVIYHRSASWPACSHPQTRSNNEEKCWKLSLKNISTTQQLTKKNLPRQHGCSACSQRHLPGKLRMLYLLQDMHLPTSSALADAQWRDGLRWLHPSLL
jgi:hypothetical protein